MNWTLQPGQPSFPPNLCALRARRMPRPCRGGESFLSRFTRDPCSSTPLRQTHRTQLTLLSTIDCALFGSFNAHKQPINPFLFFHFRTLVIKHPGVTFDSSPGFCFGSRRSTRSPVSLCALCANSVPSAVCTLFPVGRQPLASSVLLPASSLEQPASRLNPVRICTEHARKDAPSPSLRSFGTMNPERAQRVEGSHPNILSPTPTYQDLTRNSFRINTYKSVTKQRTLTTFRINTYKELGEGARHARSFPPPNPNGVLANDTGSRSHLGLVEIHYVADRRRMIGFAKFVSARGAS
jgi:hypothetical protein